VRFFTTFSNQLINCRHSVLNLSTYRVSLYGL
jgi:hypothetical protein